MAKQRNREEVINTQLAVLISRYGVKADAETIHLRGLHRPDVLFEMRGLRLVIEGKFADNPAAKVVVLDDARRRVRSGLAHIAAAVIYPNELRHTPTTEVLKVLRTAKCCFKIISETDEWEEWHEGTPSEIMEAFRRAQEGLTKDDIVAITADALSAKIEDVARLWTGQIGACDRLSKLLGITAPKGETTESAAQRRETVAKVSALVLANAYIFQEQLAQSDERVDALIKIERKKDVISATQEHWRWIWENINYISIFQLGERVLLELPATPHSRTAVKALLAQAKDICSNQAALRHDLMGRIYHWLLHTAKYLGTYYTSVSAATLLMKLTLSRSWDRDFGSARELADFKVADLACGTGTLLMAAAQAFTDTYIRVRSSSDERTITEKDLSTLHSTLMQNVLHGYDVLPSALHLTASTLAMLAPEVAFRSMNLYVLPLGMDHGKPRLGSLDFLNTNKIKTQFALDETQTEIIRTGVSQNNYANAEIPALDLCVMNPPFVRSVGGNLLFGSYPDERGDLQADLKKQIELSQISASTTAGLGSVFVALADKRLKRGGRLAFVLPAALVSGEAWGLTRRLIADRYHLEMVISSHDAERANFSENTDLSEVLFIARKLEPKGKPATTTFVNLWHNPRSIHEALDVASRIEAVDDPSSVLGQGVTAIRSETLKVGEAVSTPCPVAGENWTGALFAQTDLMRAYWSVERGKLRVPGSNAVGSIPMCRLAEIGVLGYDRRDIHDAFEVSKTDWSTYDAFWGHEYKKVKTIAQEPTEKLIARNKPAKGRKLKSATAVWEKSGDILLAERLRTNTHRLIAVGFSKPVLGGTWWAFSATSLSTDQKKALLLWLNSSLSLLLFYGRRVITEGAWMQMKKPGWAAMPVLDVRALPVLHCSLLAQVYDDVAGKELCSLSLLENDTIRQQIDGAFSRILHLPDIAVVRQLLAREPGLSGKSLVVKHAPAAYVAPTVEYLEEQISLAI